MGKRTWKSITQTAGEDIAGRFSYNPCSSLPKRGSFRIPGNKSIAPKCTYRSQEFITTSYCPMTSASSVPSIGTDTSAPLSTPVLTASGSNGLESRKSSGSSRLERKDMASFTFGNGRGSITALPFEIPTIVIIRFISLYISGNDRHFRGCNQAAIGGTFINCFAIAKRSGNEMILSPSVERRGVSPTGFFCRHFGRTAAPGLAPIRPAGGEMCRQKFHSYSWVVSVPGDKVSTLIRKIRAGRETGAARNDRHCLRRNEWPYLTGLRPLILQLQKQLLKHREFRPDYHHPRKCVDSNTHLVRRSGRIDAGLDVISVDTFGSYAPHRRRWSGGNCRQTGTGPKRTNPG